MKRKLVALVVLSLLCLSLVAPMAVAAAKTSVVKLPANYTGLNVRSGPGTNYDVAGWVIEGDKVELIKVGSDWTKIRVERSGKVGYIKNAYIKTTSQGGGSGSINPPMTGAASAGRVSGGSVNLRKGPGTGYGVVRSLSVGTKLKIWSTDGNWNYVSTLSGDKGWISKTYVIAGYSMTTSAGVNMRKAPNGEVIRSVAKGTTVTVQQITGNWSKVKLNAQVGYIFNDYLK